MKDQADVLIIGSGTAGTVLASRLTEDSGLRVLLVEAGEDTPPGSVPEDISDVFPRAYANPAYFWPKLQAVARHGAPRAPYPQARVMGGGSSVMGMWALRGLPDDYDGWAAEGADGWSYSDVLPFFKKLETDVDMHDAAHGRDGPTMIRRVPHEQWPPFNKALGEAARRRQLPIIQDFNSGKVMDGVGPIPSSNDGTARVSAPSAYLSNGVRSRPNLQILAKTEVLRLVFDGRRAVGAVARLADGSTRTLRGATIVVATGAVHSPALLQRSGIGPGGMLKAAGIEPLVDLAEVGGNLQNHIFVHLGAVIRPGARQNPALKPHAMAGVRFSSGLAGAPESDLFMSFITRTSTFSSGNALGIVGPSLYASFSRGTVSLDQKDPQGEPVVDFNLLKDPRDAERLLRAARFARSLLEDEALKAVVQETFVLPPNPPTRLLNSPGISSQLIGIVLSGVLSMGPRVRRRALAAGIGAGRFLDELTSEAAFDEMVIKSSTPMFHPAGTCAIGRVVDTHGRVKGVDNLRVVDASIMPNVPRANTNIPTLMVAEKCAAHLKGDLRNG